MKKILSYSFLAVLVLLGACRKADNPKIPTLARVPVPYVVVDQTKDVSISATNPASFSGAFTVGLFFPNDIKPTKMDVVARKNGNNSNIKVFSAGLATWPTVFTINGTQLATLFGATPVLGDKYDFGVDIYTQDGTKYEAFPAVGSGYGAGVQGEYGLISLVASYGVLCKFTASEFAGTFDITLDPWQDFLPATTQLTMTVIDASHLSFPSPVSGNPVVLNVNVLTNEITVNSAGYGNYGDGPITVVSSGGAAKNFVSPCTHTIDLALNYTLPTLGAQYSGGPYALRLVKH